MVSEGGISPPQGPQTSKQSATRSERFLSFVSPTTCSSKNETQRHVDVRRTPPKTEMTMGKKHLKMYSPIKNGHFPLPALFFGRVFTPEKTPQKVAPAIQVLTKTGRTSGERPPVSTKMEKRNICTSFCAVSWNFMNCHGCFSWIERGFVHGFLC